MSPGELFGPYRLEELIGHGGMGEVHRAYDTRRDRVVALKILPPAMATPQFEARFRQECRLVARLAAPHVIPIHDFGEIDGRLFLDMRLVRGVDLETVLEAGQLTPDRAVEMISQLATALDAAHADGLLHRDVKPSNVLYVGDPRQRWPGDDEVDFVYLVDFGIARSLDQGTSLTATGHAVGTLAYMAPERFTGEPADRRVDVYALACTLYEALVARPAFVGLDLAQQMFAHLHRMPTPVSRIDRSLPAALDDVLATGLAKNQADRYASAGRFAEAARAALRGRPRPARTKTLHPEVEGPAPAADGSPGSTTPPGPAEPATDAAAIPTSEPDRPRIPSAVAGPADQPGLAAHAEQPGSAVPAEQPDLDAQFAGPRRAAPAPVPYPPVPNPPVPNPPVPNPPVPNPPAGAGSVHPGSYPAGLHPRSTTPARRRAPGRRALQIGGATLAAAVLVAGAIVGGRALIPAPAQALPLSSCGTNPLTCNAAEPDQLLPGGQVTVAVDANIANWNVAAPTGSLGPAPWAMSTVLPYTYTVAPDFTRTLNTDLLSGAELTTPTTAVYTIKPTARWDDGTPVGVDDFVLNWRMRNGRDCPGCLGDPTGYDRIVSITGGPAADGGRTVVVTFDSPVPDWTALFASTSPLYPAHLAARRGDPGSAAGLQSAYEWFGSTVPNYSAGPLAVQSWRPDQQLVLARNPSWYGRPARLDQVVLRIMPDPAEQVRALRDGRVQVIAPYGRAGLADQLTGAPDVALYQGDGLAWERVDLNLRTPALRTPALRRALFTAIDLNRVRAIGAAAFGRAEPLSGHLLVPGQPGYQDVQAGTGQGSGDLAAARRILTAAGYTGVGSALVGPDGAPVPPLRAVYLPVHPARQPVAEYLAEAARGLGLTVRTEEITADAYGSTLTAGRFDLMIYGWATPPAQLADVQASWTTDGTSNYGGYSNPRVDRLIADAAADRDPAAAADLLTQADRLLTQDAYVLPLFRRSTLLAVRQEVADVRPNATVGPLYNVVDWGLRR